MLAVWYENLHSYEVSVRNDMNDMGSTLIKENDVLDGYRVIRFLGSGGFGEVWLCQSEAMGDYRALKMIPQSNLEHLTKEYQSLGYYRNAAAKLRSPHIVTIEHANRNDVGFYYIMPLADGADGADVVEDAGRVVTLAPTDENWVPLSLSQMIESQKAKASWFTSAEIKEIVSALLQALQTISDAGLVHRDVKPDNVLYFDGKPCLCDISLLGEDAAIITRRGTPGYGTPSWYLGGHPDMYGVAATLYTLLTGNAPDKMGRSAFLMPPQGEESLSDAEKLEWKRMHQAIGRAIEEAVADRFVDFRTMEKFLCRRDAESSEGKSPAEYQMNHETQARKSRRGLIVFSVIGVLLCIVAAIIISRPQEDGSTAENDKESSEQTNINQSSAEDTDQDLKTAEPNSQTPVSEAEGDPEKVANSPKVPPKVPSKYPELTSEEQADYKIMAGMIQGYMTYGKYELALATVDSLYETYPQSHEQPSYSIIRAMALTALGKTEEAKEELKKEVHISPQISPMVERKRLWEELGDLAAAEADLTRIINKYGGATMVLYLRADIRCQRANYSGALDDRQLAMELNPEEIQQRSLVNDMWKPLAKKYPEFDNLLTDFLEEEARKVKSTNVIHDRLWILDVFDKITDDIVNPGQAEQLSEQAMTARKALALKIRESYEAGDYSKSLRILEDVFYSVPSLKKVPSLSLYRALLYKNLGDEKKFEAELVNIIHHDTSPSSAEARVALLNSIDRRKQAVDLLNRMMSEIQTARREMQTDRSGPLKLDLLQYKKDKEEAMAGYKQMIELYLLRARVNAVMGQYENTQSDLQDASDIVHERFQGEDRADAKTSISAKRELFMSIYPDYAAFLEN